MDLSNSSAIITGGGTGLGEACARRLSQLGAKCIVVDLNEEKGNAVAGDIGGQFIKADVSKTEQVQAAVDAALAIAPVRAVVTGAGSGSAGRTVDRSGNPSDLATFEQV